MSLELYKQKRNFQQTPEPDSGTNVKKSKLTFVVHRHDATRLHYDLRLEMEGVLKSWAVPKGPSMVPGERRLAIMVEDHPLTYGEFYGEIPEGNYGAGKVEIWDQGPYLPVEENGEPEENLLAQLQQGSIKFVVNGHYLKGEFTLVRIQGKEKEDEWLLIKKKDEYALTEFNIEDLNPLKSATRQALSVPDDVSAILEPRAPGNEKRVGFPQMVLEPMLAKLSAEVIDDPSWIYEMKYDGYRLISKIDKEKVEMISRNGKSFNQIYPELADELSDIEESVVIDGEIVIEDKKGISNFQLLQNFRTTRKGELKYYVFDLLYLNGHLLTDFPLVKRKELLDAFFKMYNFKHIFNAPYQTGNGKELYEKLSNEGYEGIIAKAPESKYLPGKRSDNWLKIKAVAMQEAKHEIKQKSSKVEETMTIGGKKVKCTNLNKAYWPEEGYTKADLISYYLSISKYLLPHLKNRPQSLNRHPNGIKSKNFYQKDMDVSQLPVWAKTVKVFSKSNEEFIDYLVCNDTATLVYMANLGCIEINPWHSTYLAPDEPSYLMLDLDPGDVPFTEVVNTALAIKEICDEINIPAYCKTSGATGLHIFIPLGAKYSYSDARTFAHLIATIANDRMPGTTSIERSVEKRKDKVYIDYMQNSKSQTIASAYSVRPQPMATVSTPLDWKEVNYQLTPQMFTIRNVPDRLRAMGDLWSPVHKKGIVISRALKALEKL